MRSRCRLTCYFPSCASHALPDALGCMLASCLSTRCPDLQCIWIWLVGCSLSRQSMAPNASPADVVSALLHLSCPFQNFKSAVRRLEHTTLLLTALALPQQPDLLMLWATEGYSPFVDPSEGQGVRLSRFSSLPLQANACVLRNDGNDAGCPVSSSPVAPHDARLSFTSLCIPRSVMNA